MKKPLLLKHSNRHTTASSLCIIYLFLVFPFSVFGISCKSGLSKYPWFCGSEYQTDFYLTLRSYSLNISGILILLYLLFNLYRMHKKHILSDFLFSITGHKLLFVIILAYVILLILSTAFSVDRMSSLHGGFEQFESVFTLLSYLLIMLFFLFVSSDTDINTDSGESLLSQKSFKVCLFASSSILIVLAFLQKKEVYLTFYNPDYAAEYLLMLLPFLAVFTMISFHEKRWCPVTVFYLIVTIGIFFCLPATHCLYACCLLFLEVLIMIFLLYRSRRIIRLILMVVTCCLCVGACIFLAYRHNISQDSGSDSDNKAAVISAISTDENCVTVTLDKTTYSFTADLHDSESVAASDIDYIDSCLNYTICTRTLQDGTVLHGFSLDTGYETQFFTNKTADGTYFFLSPYQTLLKLHPATAVIFQNNPNFLSGRGYIWARTLPLFHTDFFRLLVGFGPDSFLIVFPKGDYAAALQAGYLYQLITRPHSLYLQIALQTGLPSLFAFLLLCGISICNSISYLKNTKKIPLHTAGSSAELLRIAVFCSIISYLLFGLLNDSCVVVSPFFWCLLGISLGNHHCLHAS